MASRTITTLIDDVDGSVAQETIAFSLDGVDYEIDLSAANASALREVVTCWGGKARRAGRAGNARRTLKPVGASRSALIRAWAAQQGLVVPARGRIPTEVQRSYDDAH